MVRSRFSSIYRHHQPVEETQPSTVRPPASPTYPTGIPLILSEIATTTTTEVVTATTQTTTHFFSLPLSWKKRGPSTSPQRPANGSAHPKVSMPDNFRGRYEKALPPTPPADPPSFPQGYSTPTSILDSAEEIAQESQLPSLFPPESSQNTHPTPSQQSSTAALAQAALGLGFPHTLPHASASTSSSTFTSEVNTVAFSSLPSPNHSRPSSVRKVKSYSKIKISSAGDPPPVPEADGRRRSRGMSLGTTAFLNFGPSDAKGKGKELEPQTSPAKSLSRRPSFWNRKKSTTTDIPIAPGSTKSSEGFFLPLPSLQPISPFSMTPIPSTSSDQSELNSTHSRGLSRSHSERARSGPSLIPPNEKPQDHPNPKPRTRRASRRPATADPSSHRVAAAKALFADSQRPWTSSRLTTTPPVESVYSPSLSDSIEQSRRPRALTNPPLLHRLSLNLFSSSSTPPPSSHPNVSTELLPQSVSNSPRPSLQREPIDIPKPVDGESPEVYLRRLNVAINKADIAGVLATSADEFHAKALRAYIAQFDFTSDALDIALRRLLMDVGLPRETQQIDRVMEAFAERYEQCNPGLFVSDDHAYILAFSLIMLHTDAFNKSNKRKMNKADYIKNTTLPGISPEVLDCFYDNIVFAPFIFIEDPVDLTGQRGSASDGASNRMLSSMGGSTTTPTGGPTLIGKSGSKVDPYYLISNNLLGPLRIDVEVYVPLSNPFSFQGTAGPWDEEELQRAFANARLIEVGAVEQSRPSSTFFSLSGVGPPSPLISGLGTFPELPPPPPGEVWTLKVTKAGILNRKDDTFEGGRKASNRKWRTWSVLLTGSQLLFFKDPSWATAILTHSESSDGQVFIPHTSVFRPDESFSVKDAIAVYDFTYNKHRNTLRFVMADGRQFLLQAKNEQELNAWLSHINYASAFKSVGVRMRPPGMSGKDVHLTGVAAATSHLHDLQHANTTSTPRVKHWGSDTSHELMGMLSSDPAEPPKRMPQRRVTIKGDMELEAPEAPEVDGADQFKATFDQVKADLAAGRLAKSDDESSSGCSPSDSSPDTSLSSGSLPSNNFWKVPSRAQVIRSKLVELESNVNATRGQLNSEMRFVRNIAALSPFQRSTRDRLVVALQGIAKRIMQVRIVLVRLECHRYVLSCDLDAEGRDWSRAKKIALKAATETLASQQQHRRQQQPQESIPRMTLSFHEDATYPSSSVHSPPRSMSQSPHVPESTCESFHSALDFGPEWLSTDDFGFLGTLEMAERDRRSSGSLQLYPFHDVISSSPQQSPPSSRPASFGRRSNGASPRTSDEMRTHEKYYTARETPEEAEQWNKTRCAQRVSLVRVPSSFLSLSNRFERRSNGDPALS